MHDIQLMKRFWGKTYQHWSHSQSRAVFFYCCALQLEVAKAKYQSIRNNFQLKLSHKVVIKNTSDIEFLSMDSYVQTQLSIDLSNWSLNDGDKGGGNSRPLKKKNLFTKCCTSPLSVGRWAVASRLLPYRIRNITYNFFLYIHDVNACLPLPVQNRLSQAVMSILQMHLRRTQQQMKDGFCQNLKLNNNIDSHHVPDIQKKKSTEDHQKPVE